MSEIIRNLLTLFQAFFSSARCDAQSCVNSHFWITPLDTGIRVLKSDKYLQLAEAAQLDFLVKTELIAKLLKSGYQFVNASQLVKFMKPISLFQRVRVKTEIVYADEKWVYFSHLLFVADKAHGEVLVKMKFKNGPITVCPRHIIWGWSANKPPHLQAWDSALDGM